MSADNTGLNALYLKNPKNLESKKSKNPITKIRSYGSMADFKFIDILASGWSNIQAAAPFPLE